MTDLRDAVRRHLAQRIELGEREIFLEGGSAEALLASVEPAAAIVAEPAQAAVRAHGSAEPTPEDLARRRQTPDLPAEEIVRIDDFDRLREVALGCTRCRLAESRNQVVFGEGDPAAAVMVVGEAPGAEEDRTGRPFVGRAGKLLDLLLRSIGFEREQVYICNVLKCRPPGNRNPRPDEVETCSPYLLRQVEMVAPSAILACGTFAAQTLLETGTPIGKLRGTAHDYHGVPLVPTYHPAALLRNPAWVRLAWEDAQRVRTLVDAG
jgi:uracil-DNA glycosylase